MPTAMSTETFNAAIRADEAREDHLHAVTQAKAAAVLLRHTAEVLARRDAAVAAATKALRLAEDNLADRCYDDWKRARTAPPAA